MIINSDTNLNISTNFNFSADVPGNFTKAFYTN